MVDTAIIADIPLFHTIAQTSATFVAIVAGFYTLKIVTLSNDKRRLLQRINELDNEFRAKDDYLKELKKSESDIDNESDKDTIRHLIEYITDDYDKYENIHSFEDLKKWFEKYYGFLPTDNQERILKKWSVEGLKALEEARKEGKKRSELRLASLLRHVSDQSFHSALLAQSGINQLHDLRKKIRDLQAEVQGLQKVKKYYEGEYNSIAYPNYIIFGLGSFIFFAIVGVIFPLTYEWWVIPLFTYYGYDYNVNSLVVVLFGAGLSITFVYIGAELYDAISLGKTKNRKPTTTENKEPATTEIKEPPTTENE
jgi:hypothetical protein